MIFIPWDSLMGNDTRMKLSNTFLLKISFSTRTVRSWFTIGNAKDMNIVRGIRLYFCDIKPQFI